MHSLQKQFHDYIHSNDLVRNDEKVLLAVSGGLDSMVMAKLFLDEGIPVSVAHCNFGLRGEESYGDEAFVMKWAEDHQISCFVKSFDLGDGSIQLEARNARYKWFNELVVEHGFQKIATAHHLNDSLETVLINLSRGTGIKGLAGISTSNGKVIRPLLFASRDDLHTYAMDLRLTWREDSSNQKTEYDRNLIRKEVMPKLERLNPALLKTYVLTNERINHVGSIISRKVKEIETEYLREEKGGWRLEMDWISTGSDELILAEVLALFGVNYTTAKEIFAARGKSGKSFPTGEWFLTMDRSTIFIDPQKSEDDNELIISEEGSFNLGNGVVEVSRINMTEVHFTSESEAYFDLSKLIFPLRVRTWKEGDRFHPLGMKGSKKVSDLLVDEKVPVSQKKHVKIVESAGKIAWVVGYRVSDQYKVTDHTTEVIRVNFNLPEYS